MMAITFNGFNARTDHINPFEHIGRNKNFLYVMGSILLMQFVFVTFGGEVLSVESLDLRSWILCAVIAFLVIPINMMPQVDNQKEIIYTKTCANFQIGAGLLLLLGKETRRVVYIAQTCQIKSQEHARLFWHNTQKAARRCDMADSSFHRRKIGRGGTNVLFILTYTGIWVYNNDRINVPFGRVKTCRKPRRMQVS